MEITQSIPQDFKPDASTLDGRVILVSGAGSDQGRAVSLAASAAGATVLLHDSKKRHVAPVYDAICKAGSPEPMMIEFDLQRADEETFSNLSTSLGQAYPKIHGLVHCAIWGAPLSPVINSNADTWLAVYQQQLVKPMMLTRAMAPLLNHEQPASIVFTVMDTGRHGRAYWGAVGCAFAALENLSEILAAEFQQYNTRCNSLDPGRVRTAIRRKFYPAEDGAGLRVSDDPEIMRYYLYLLADQSEQLSAYRFTVPHLDQADSEVS